MKLKDMIAEINTLIDDELPDDWITGFINDAYAEVGSSVHAVFPEYTEYDKYQELELPPKWQRLLIKTMAAGRAKEQDSSQFEYRDLYAQYDQSLNDFKASYVVPDQYKELYPGKSLIVTDDVTVTTESGDTLGAIADAHSTTVSAIGNLNDSIQFVTDSETMDILDAPAYPWMNAF